MNKILVYTILVLGIIGFAVYMFILVEPKENEVIINSFEECANAGYAVMESYPRQCNTSDGRNFVEYIGNEFEKLDFIQIDNPRPNQEVKSPLMVFGKARGFWFFETGFFVYLLNEEGKEIAFGVAQAQDEWMSEDFVPFAVTLEFEKPLASKGVLILEKDNISGLSENKYELRVPVNFDLSASYDKSKQKECMITGCSGQICFEEEIITTCEYKQEYACYKNAQCERQKNGECDWTLTEELQICLMNNK